MLLYKIISSYHPETTASHYSLLTGLGLQWPNRILDSFSPVFCNLPISCNDSLIPTTAIYWAPTTCQALGLQQCWAKTPTRVELTWGRDGVGVATEIPSFLCWVNYFTCVSASRQVSIALLQVFQVISKSRLQPSSSLLPRLMIHE